MNDGSEQWVVEPLGNLTYTAATNENEVSVMETTAYWNCYKQRPTQYRRAHAKNLSKLLPFEKSYIFQYKIVSFQIEDESKKHYPYNNYTEPQYIPLNNKIKLFMGLWCEYGLIEVECNAVDNMVLEWTDQTEDNIPQFILKRDPKFDDIIKLPTKIVDDIQIKSPRYYSMVSPIVNNNINSFHHPICFQNVTNVRVVNPKDAVNYSISELCKVHEEKISLN